MENSVTLSKGEYDQLREIKALYETQKQTLESGDPIILRVTQNYHNEEELRVYSGETFVKQLFDGYTQRQKTQEKRVKDIEDNYKKESEELKAIRKILNK